MAHEIRLAGPWEYSTIEDEWQRSVLPFPTDIQLAGGSTVQLRRKFHRPSGLDEKSQLFIVADVSAVVSAFELNDVALPIPPTDETGEKKEIAIDVTNALEKFNTLKFTFAVQYDESTLLEAVRLRIVEPTEIPSE